MLVLLRNSSLYVMLRILSHVYNIQVCMLLISRIRIPKCQLNFLCPTVRRGIHLNCQVERPLQLLLPVYATALNQLKVNSYWTHKQTFLDWLGRGSRKILHLSQKTTKILDKTSRIFKKGKNYSSLGQINQYFVNLFSNLRD